MSNLHVITYLQVNIYSSFNTSYKDSNFSFFHMSSNRLKNLRTLNQKITNKVEVKPL